MTAEENKAIVRRYLDEVWNQGNTAAVDEFLAPNYKRYLSPITAPLTRDGQKQRLTGFRAAFPDVHLTLEDMFAAGNRVAFRVMLRGTHQGVFQGIAATDKAVAFFTVDVVRVENGKIVEHWGGPDMLSLLQQLGAEVSVRQERS